MRTANAPFVEHPVRCIACGHELQAATGVTVPGEPPEDGDVSMCFSCGALAIFEKKRHGGLRPMKPDERKAVEADKEVQDAQLAWHWQKLVDDKPKPQGGPMPELKALLPDHEAPDMLDIMFKAKAVASSLMELSGDDRAEAMTVLQMAQLLLTGPIVKSQADADRCLATLHRTVDRMRPILEKWAKEGGRAL